MTIPCKDCLLIPLCRNKSYKVLTKGCSLIQTQLYDSEGIRNFLFNEVLFKMDAELGTDFSSLLLFPKKEGK
jgi:hypothetical protein